MLKGLGAAAVLLACAALGFERSAALARRAACLQELQRLIVMLQGEIRYAKTPLSEAFLELSRRTDGALGRFFSEAASAAGQRDGRSMAEIFRTCAEESLRGSGLLDEDIGQLVRTGARLGYLDREMQVQTLLLYQEDLKREGAAAREDYQRRGKMYRRLGILSGCFLIILLT